MSRLCEACQHPSRKEIDLALTHHLVSYKRIAAYYGLSYGGVRRHERQCLVRSFAQSQELQAMVSAENLIERLNKWEERMDDQYAKADAAGEIFAAAATARVGTSAVHSIDKIAQEAPLKQRIRDLEQQLAMKDALLAAAQLALHAQQSATSALPTPSPDSLRVILKTLIQGNAAIGPEDIDAYDDASPPVESEARNGTDDAR